MVKKKGPIEGVRVPVELPWKGVAHNTKQFVSIKKPVVEYFKFAIAKKEALTYKGKIRYKKLDKDNEPTGPLLIKEVERTRRPGYKQRGLRVIFGTRETGEKKKVSIGGKSVYSVQFPITRSVSISEIREEFISGKWKDLPVIRIADANSGQGYPIY